MNATTRTPVCSHCSAELRPTARFCDSCGQPVPPPAPAPPEPTARPLPGAFAGGRYRVQRFLGEGAKKRVYLAHDSRLDRDVAIALIKTDGLDEAGLARVRREARAMGRLGDHPHIVTVHDIGDEGAQPYIVSQYMSGGDVETRLQRAEHHRLPISDALQIVDQICQALEHAHRHGVIHRDLKPGNVWLTEDGTAKLGDFGLAVALNRSRLTQEGMMVGTVAYMAPEQALGKSPDTRSDLYGLGATLYEMVTGRPPFLGDDAVAIISQHINTAPVAPSWHNPEVPRALESLIMRLLAKIPEERPENAAAVRQALSTIASAVATVTDQVKREDANPLDRLASGVFVGREREMDELRAGLEDAFSGHGRLLMLVGEPGIGKTRTSEELATYARLRNAQVLWGRCYEGEGAPAYWPWVQGIRAYAHERDPGALVSELGSGAGVIAQIVSEVRDRLPNLPAPPPVTDPDQARFRLFDSITMFFKNAAQRQPLVLVLDDLHSADKPSLLLLQFVARELRGARLLIVGTYRDVDLGRQHPLSQTLGDLTREQLSQRILLRGLTQNDVARFIEITAGITPPPGLISAVYKETEGNPFFVNEVVRLLVADGRLEHPEQVKSWSVSIPQGVREVVGRRLDHLSPECNRVLTTGAVIGREFGMDALERLSHLSEDRLLEVLDEAVAARVINEVPRSAGRYSFSHALIRETLYSELTTNRRVRLHRQVGEVLETLYVPSPEAHLAELAYHFFEAAQGGDVDKAIDYAVRAGDRATALMAHEEAARQYEVGLQALELRQPADPERRCELLLARGEALWRAGEYEQAKQLALEAAEIARRQDAPQQLARAALGYGGRLLAFAAVIRDDTLVRLLEEALGKLANDATALRARLLSRLAEEVTFSEPLERREALCREAVAIARRVGDPAVLAAALRGTHWSLWVPANVQERVAISNEMVALGEQSGDRTLQLEGRLFHLWNQLELGEIAAAQREFDVGVRLAEQLRQPYLAWNIAYCRVLLALAQGRLPEVEALALQALQMGQEAENKNATLVFGIQTAVLFRELGRVQEIEPLLASFAEMFPSIGVNLRSAQAVVLVDQRRFDEARTIFDELAEDDFAALPPNIAWIFSIAFLAEVCAALRHAERAAVLYELLRPYAARNVMIGNVLVFGAAARYLGLLAMTLQRWEDAARWFEDAIVMNTRTGMRHALAHSQTDYATMLLARPDVGAEGSNPERQRAKALELLNRAISTANELGMKPLIEQALALKLRAQGASSAALLSSIDALTVAVQHNRPDVRPHAGPDGTVTLMFSDMEGFTAMTERLGDLRAHQVIASHNKIVREQVAAHGGFELELQGDGFLLAFPTPRQGLACAVAIQKRMATYGVQHPDEPIRVRIGLHSGEAIQAGDKFFGKTVILAARIAAQARGGEILVSDRVKLAGEKAEGPRFGEARTVALKGLSGSYALYPVEWRTNDR